MDFPLVYVIVINWNGYDDTVECLLSLFKMDYPNYRIVVVDNGSVDDSLRLENFSDRITLLKSETNLGYAGGNKLGMRHALANGIEYVGLWNNDTVVPPDALAKLVTGAINGRIGVA
jgi:GT2 family glycosyltransferase